MMRIGELGKKADCPVQTVRFYESEGLLPEPARSQGNFRLYDDAHLQRLLFIRHCRAKDMTLEEIRQLLSFRDRPERDCGEVNAVLDRLRRAPGVHAHETGIRIQWRAPHLVDGAQPAIPDVGVIGQAAPVERGLRHGPSGRGKDPHDHGIARLDRPETAEIDLLGEELLETRPDDGVVIHDADFDHCLPFFPPGDFIVPHFRLEMAYP